MKKLFTLLLTFIALTASAQTSMHVYSKSSGHSIYYVSNVDSIAFIDDQAGAVGEGTLQSPYNVAGALKAGSQLAYQDHAAIDSVYVKGYVVRLQSAPLTQYGNASYYLSDSKAITNRLYVYRGYSLGNLPFAADDELKLGDEVVVCGKIFKYSDDMVEFTSSFIYSINGQTFVDLRKGDGTLENPFNAFAAAAYARSLGASTPSDKAVYIKGKVASITDPFSTTYGNGSFYISDDGTTSNTFYAFRTLYLGNQRFKEGNTQIKEGDEVIICGKVINYNGHPETVVGESYLYSLNGVTGGGETPTPEAKGSGTQADPYNPLGAINYISSLPANQESETDIYIKGKVSTIKYNFTADYGNATFYISEDGTASNEFYCYRTLYLNNEKYTSGYLLNVGDEVVICGKVVNYRGNTPETVQNKSYLFSLTPVNGTF